MIITSQMYKNYKGVAGEQDKQESSSSSEESCSDDTPKKSPRKVALKP